MDDKVISLDDVRKRRAEAANTAAKNRGQDNMASLIEGMRYLCNRALNQGGIDLMHVLGASLYLTAEIIARTDPGLDKPEFREAIFRVLDRQCDETLLTIWQTGGIPTKDAADETT